MGKLIVEWSCEDVELKECALLFRPTFKTGTKPVLKTFAFCNNFLSTCISLSLSLSLFLSFFLSFFLLPTCIFLSFFLSFYLQIVLSFILFWNVFFSFLVNGICAHYSKANSSIDHLLSSLPALTTLSGSIDRHMCTYRCRVFFNKQPVSKTNFLSFKAYLPTFLRVFTHLGFAPCYHSIVCLYWLWQHILGPLENLSKSSRRVRIISQTKISVNNKYIKY